MNKANEFRSAFQQIITNILSQNGGGAQALQRLAIKEELSEEEVILIQSHVNAAKANQRLDNLLAKFN